MYSTKKGNNPSKGIAMKKMILSTLIIAIPSLYTMDERERKPTKQTWFEMVEQSEKEEREAKEALQTRLAAIEHNIHFLFMVQQRQLEQQAYTNALLEHLIQLTRAITAPARPAGPPALIQKYRKH